MSEREEMNVLGVSLSLGDVIDIAIRTGRFSESIQIQHYENNLLYDGCLEHIDSIAVKDNKGEYYVYVWKHAFGEPFYVGSGKDRRWLDRNRNQECLLHIDKADSIVYKVLVGTDAVTARKCEKFVSLLFMLHGVKITNADSCIRIRNENTIERLKKEFGEMLELPLLQEVKSKVLHEVLGQDKLPYEAALGQQSFLERYGKTYYSNKYGRIS